MDKNLVQRALAGIVFLAVMIGCICYNTWTVATLFYILGLVGSYELLKLIDKRLPLGKPLFYILGFHAIAGLLLLILPQYGYDDLNLAAFIAVFIAIGLAVFFLVNNPVERRLVLSMSFLVSFFYPFLAFFSFNILVYVIFDNYLYFRLLYLFILIWTNDTMAYVTGRLLGRHKLAPEISPNKTVEGFIGGIVFTTIASAIAGHYYPEHFTNPIFVWVAPAVVGVFATIGDLLESSLKRWAGVKDSGNLIPGHGGVLDRFDGALLAVWPYILLLIILR